MNKKFKLFSIIVGLIIIIGLSIGISYAYYLFSISQQGVNAVNSDCFKITYSDNGALNLLDTIPLTEEEAISLQPYTFTINNICNHALDYSVNVETLSSTTIDLNAVRLKLDNNASRILGSIKNNDSSMFANSNTISSKTIFSGSLKEKESKTFDLLIWIDEDATKEQAANKIFSSKIVITSILNSNYSEGTLISGSSFNAKIKSLAGDENASISTMNTTITSILKSETPPTEEDNYIEVSESTSDNPIYAWFDNGVIYIYSKNSKIYLNSDSSNLFFTLFNLSSLDLGFFDTSNVENMTMMFGAVSNLTNLDLRNFDTSNVTDMTGMFAEMVNLKKLNVSSFNTSNVERMLMMFGGVMKITELDISSFDTSNVTDMSGMFTNMTNVKTIYVGNNWSTNKVASSEKMFETDTNLVGGDGTLFDSNYIDASYARVDDLENTNPGYLTLKTN